MMHVNRHRAVCGFRGMKCVFGHLNGKQAALKCRGGGTARRRVYRAHAVIRDIRIAPDAHEADTPNARTHAVMDTTTITARAR